MIRLAALLLLSLSPVAHAQLQHEQEIQRALVQRDQQSAEFAAGVRGASPGTLETLHARQLSEAMLPLAPELRPYQRARMAEDRALVLAPPVRRSVPVPDLPLALPGGPRSSVDPIAPQGLPY